MVAEFWADAGEATIDAHIATASIVAARGRRRDIMTCTVRTLGNEVRLGRLDKEAKQT